MSQSLDELVAEGVITQAQADAVRSRVDTTRQKWADEHPRMGHGGFAELRESAQAVADTLGLSVGDVLAALGDGSSLNDLAAQQGVDPAAISQILVDAANARVDQGVTDGKLSQDKADEIKAKTAENIGKVMDGSVKDFGLGGPGGGRFGHGPRGGADGGTDSGD